MVEKIILISFVVLIASAILSFATNILDKSTNFRYHILENVLTILVVVMGVSAIAFLVSIFYLGFSSL